MLIAYRVSYITAMFRKDAQKIINRLCKEKAHNNCFGCRLLSTKDYPNCREKVPVRFM